MKKLSNHLLLPVWTAELTYTIGGIKSVNTEVAIKNEQIRETGSIAYTRRRKTKQKHNTICVGHHYAQTNLLIE
jgi:hypothetical protein